MVCQQRNSLWQLYRTPKSVNSAELRTSLVVLWLRSCFQSRGHEFDSCWGSKILSTERKLNKPECYKERSCIKQQKPQGSQITKCFFIKSNVDLKQIDCQIFLQQRWAHFRSAENYSPGAAIMVSHVQVLAKQVKEDPFIEGKRKPGGLQ